MPRAFCPECGSEVPVDADGVCHVGHRVETAGASAAPGGDLDASFPTAPVESDEPQPWVANVDETTLGGYTPPPGGADATGTAPAAPPPDSPASTPPAASADADEPAWSPGDEAEPGDTPDEAPSAGSDDLAAAAAAAIESLAGDDDEATPWSSDIGPDPVEGQGQDVEAGWPQTLPSEGPVTGWTPPTNDPVAPPPSPAPAPVEPPAPAAGDDDLGAGDFDLDDLAAAVSELGMDDPEAAPTTGAAPAAAEPATDGAGPADDGGWADDLDDAATGDERDADADAGAPDRGPSDAEPVDLSNFTARGGKGKGGRDAGKGGLFRRR